MSLIKREHTTFNGGISPFEKQGIEGSARWLEALDIHQDPNYVTLAQSVSKVSSTTATDLVKWMKDASPYNTNRYAYGDAGKLYGIDSSDTFSLLRTVTNGYGGGLEVFDDYLYYPTLTTIGRYGKLSGTPAFNDDFLSDGTTNVDQSATTTGQTYTLPTSISEGATATKTFVPTRDPIKAILVSVNTVGTGAWTVTLHDSANTVLGTVTIANASMATGYVTFTFSSPIRLTIANTYHFHVTVASGTSKVDTATNADLSTVAYKTTFGILLSHSEHPMKEFLNFLVIGNTNYLAVWNRATYNPNRITFKPGFICHSLTIKNEFLVAACYKGADINNCEDARLYYWDGTADSFNYFDPVSMGYPNCIHTKFNKLIGLYGSSGSLNLGSVPFQQVQDVPSLSPTKYVEIYPGAITEWQTKTYIGVGGATNDTALTQGIYEYGSLNTQYPDVLSYKYTISTGTKTGTGMKVGCVFGIGDSLYFSWKDGASYGVDKVVKNATSASYGEWRSLIFDDGSPVKTKSALKLVIKHLPLVSGESVQGEFRIDRATTFQTGAINSTAGTTRTVYEIPTSYQRFKECEYGFILRSGGTYPKILEVYLEYDPLDNEIASD